MYQLRETHNYDPRSNTSRENNVCLCDDSLSLMKLSLLRPCREPVCQGLGAAGFSLTSDLFYYITKTEPTCSQEFTWNLVICSFTFSKPGIEPPTWLVDEPFLPPESPIYWSGSNTYCVFADSSFHHRLFHICCLYFPLHKNRCYQYAPCSMSLLTNK